MKKILTTLLFAGLAWFSLTGMKCETRNIEVPVLHFSEAPLWVRTSESEFQQSGMYNASDDINQIREEEEFLEILTVNLQSVTYTLLTNSSSPGTLIDGFIEVSESESGPYKTVVRLDDVNLDAILGVEQAPDLNAEGVEVINSALSIFSGGELTFGSKKLYYRVRGTASSSGSTDLDFILAVKIYLNIVGVVEAEVPTGI